MTATPSTASPQRGRPLQSSNSAPSRNATGARSKWVRIIAPHSSGVSAAASSARWLLPPVRAASTAQSSITAAANRNIQPANASRKES